MAGLSDAWAPYTAPVSEFTTPGDMQREHLSAAFGWDVGRPWQEFARRALLELPLALRTATPWMLSPNLTRRPGEFSYRMLDTAGASRGGLLGRMIDEGSDQTAHISWVGNNGRLENALGPTGVRQLQRALIQDFPEARYITGTRVSGARRRVIQDNPNVVRPLDWRTPHMRLR